MKTRYRALQFRVHYCALFKTQILELKDSTVVYDSEFHTP